MAFQRKLPELAAYLHGTVRSKIGDHSGCFCLQIHLISAYATELLAK